MNLSHKIALHSAPRRSASGEAVPSVPDQQIFLLAIPMVLTVLDQPIASFVMKLSFSSSF